MSTTAQSPVERSFDPISISTLDFWRAPFDERDKTFAQLRQDRPVSWHPNMDFSYIEQSTPGFWAVVGHQDIQDISRNPKVFSSAEGTMLGDTPDFLSLPSSSFLNMDDPRHARLRKLVSVAFTPKRIAQFEVRLAGRATEIVNELIDRGDCDFVQNVARQLPMWSISEFMGVPQGQRHIASHAADLQASGGIDPSLNEGLEPLEAIKKSVGTLRGIGMGLAEQRRWHGEEDLITGLVNAEIDGESLTDSEIGAFCNLLSVAGNDTTRNTISHAMLALTNNPDQRQLLIDDFDRYIDSAVEEFLRWGTAVMTFRRTTTEATEIAGVPIAAGEKVVMFYNSGNRDDAAFTDPHTFDITRDPNPHLSFGGGGAHFCLGTMLARTQLKAIFREIFTRLPNLEVSDPQLMLSTFIHGVNSMPCTLNK